LLALPVIYFWAYAATPVALALGAFLMQVCVQGAWGVIPAHLNELSPPSLRATFPGVVYQLGNFIASYNLVLQTKIAAANNENYSFALAAVAVTAAIVIAILTMLGREARDVDLAVKPA
jgi:SHS family lactate transporter-like MFS transporter